MPKYIDLEDFYEQQPHHQALLRLLRETVLASDPHLREAMKYNTPFFVRKSWVCYIGIIRAKTGVEVCFPRAHSMANEHGLLQIKGRQSIMGITFDNLDDFLAKENLFLEMIQEALLLDEVSERSAVAELLGGKKK
jgi:uncharacterized protein YdhG (YjbR/CyaY superfamily)